MMDFQGLIRRYDAARSARINWDALWQDTADRVLPQQADFTTKMRSDGERRTEKMFDSTAALAAQRALAAITSFFWPSNQRYQRLAADEEESKVSQAVKTYLDAVTNSLFRARYSPRAAFEAQMSEAGISFLVFGTGVVFVDDSWAVAALRSQPRFILYKSCPLAQTYIQENAAGKIDTVHRSWRWTLRQVLQKFPGKLPESLASKAESTPDQLIDVAHSVCPREDYQPGRLGPLGKPWASVYYLPTEKLMLEEGGFDEWPFAVMRYMTVPGEVYGRSPAWLAMSNIRTLNTQKRTLLAAAQKVADPPLLAGDPGEFAVFSQAPGAMNYGALDANGNQLVKPLVTGARVDIGLDMMDKERGIIESAFFLDVFKALVDNPQMTATQALELMQERATLMAPVGGRIESEGLGPMTEREIGLLARGGNLPANMPPDLVRRGGQFKITYTSPMRQAMRASEGIAISRTLEAAVPLLSADPGALDGLAPLPVLVRELAQINGMPEKLLADQQDVQAKQAQRSQAANAQAVVQAAPQISAAAANMTRMQAAGGRPQV